MRSRAFALAGLVLALSAVGCYHCRCCGHRLSDRDRIPPQDVKQLKPPDPWENEGPPRPAPAGGPSPIPAPNAKQTGAYGGT